MFNIIMCLKEKQKPFFLLWLTRRGSHRQHLYSKNNQRSAHGSIKASGFKHRAKVGGLPCSSNSVNHGKISSSIQVSSISF